MLLITGGGNTSDDVTDVDKELSAVKWVNFDTLEVHVTCTVIIICKKYLWRHTQIKPYAKSFEIDTNEFSFYFKKHIIHYI